MKHYTVEAEGAGSRLDIWLAAQMGVSRSSLERKFKAGQILINGNPARQHHFLKINDVVAVETKIINPSPAVVSSPSSILPEIEIIKETPEYLVINKPAGLVMHPAPAYTDITLVDWLLKHYPKIAKIGDDPERPGIVHRLDREASGLVVIAKTQDSFDNLKNQFQDRLISKKYMALVYGADMLDYGEINFNIERSTQGYRMAAKPINQSGKVAITHFNVEHRYHNYTLLSLVIKTGRTHQIRAHLSAFNHPIVGDDLYGGPKQRTQNQKFKLGRIFLVAVELGFADLAGERQDFAIALPEDLQKLLDSLT